MPADGTRPRPAGSPARWFADYGEYFAVRAPSVVRLARLQLQDDSAAEDVTVRSHALYALTRLRRVLTVDGDA